MADYIDRETVLKILEEHPAGTWRGYDVYSDDVRAIMRKVDEQPAADVAPVRRGHWIEDKNSFPGFNLANNLCSECGECAGTWPKRIGPRDKYAFCPWCGAKMEVPNDD